MAKSGAEMGTAERERWERVAELLEVAQRRAMAASREADRVERKPDDYEEEPLGEPWSRSEDGWLVRMLLDGAETALAAAARIGAARYSAEGEPRDRSFF